MGESIVDASIKEDKIREMASSNPALEVSVSFGRFENDSLSWEKWSTFSPNKYLEEVEKCATPGSVAKKKAYFEEHYKKIAARKAAGLQQQQALEKQMESSKSLNSEDHNSGDLGSAQGDNKQETELVSEVSDNQIDVQNNEPENVMESQEKVETDSTVESSMLNKEEETVADEVKQEVGSEDLEELAQKSERVIEETTSKIEDKNVNSVHSELPLKSQRVNTVKIKDKNAKLGNSEKPQKITPVNKERNDTRIKKKPTSPAPAAKTTQSSTYRASKLTTSTPTTTSSASSKTPLKTGITSYSLPKTKNSSVGVSKKVALTSLHMSLSLGPSGSDPASTRKSLIMEKMGDKDIVKRAFKTFQSSYNQLKTSIPEHSPATKQVSAKGREPRISTLTTPQKENGGSSRVATSMEKKNAKGAPSYFGLKSDEKADSKKAISKKLEEKEKSNGRETERKYLRTKPKDNCDAEIKKLRQSLNFKATPLPGFYHGQRLSKSPLDKIGTKSDIHR